MKKADTKAFLQSKADRIKKKNDDGTKKGSVAQTAAEPANNVKEKKEKVLAAARKKMGMDEEQRNDYKQRAKKSKEKKQAAQAAKTSSPEQTTASVQAAATTTDVAAAVPGRLRKRDLDPTRSAFSQRVDRTMERQGLTREAAKQVVTDRRAVRKEQMATVQQQLNVGEDRSRRIVRYANQNMVTPADGSAAVPDYALAQKVVRMARNKGLTKKEANTVIAGRRQARQDAASGAQSQV